MEPCEIRDPDRTSRLGMVLLTAAFLVACGPIAAPPSRQSEFGEVVGTVEDSNGVASSSCRVLIEGAAVAGRCNPDGTFHLGAVPFGARNLIVVRERPTLTFSRRHPIGVPSGGVASAGIVGLLPTGSVGGRVQYAMSTTGVDFSMAVVAVRGLPIVAAPHMSGAFLLQNVPAGSRTVLGWGAMGAGAATVEVPAALLPNVTVSMSGNANGRLRGSVRVVDGTARGDLAIQVRARPQFAGRATDTMTTVMRRDFEVEIPAGLYWLEVSADGFSAAQVPLAGILPGETYDAGEIAIYTTADAGDLDRDGVANGTDPDIDGDGVPNAMDALPRNPWDSEDTDRDGIGNLWDPDPMGRGLPGPPIDFGDPDGDGRIDITGEDNCPGRANADQADRDMDGVGDACDNCPSIPNRDQADTNRNMVGDVCDVVCMSSTQCPAGQLCDGGRCVQCLTNAQCPQTVCVMGSCVACSATVACPMGQSCASGRCVQCLSDSQCPGGSVCQNGACRPRCTTNMDCPASQMCRAGRCTECTTTADCPTGQYCDAANLCRYECTANTDCVAGRERCELTTHRCVASCEAMAMCGARQRCDVMMICRTQCEGPGDCPSGQRCDMASSTCMPECLTNMDCGAMRTCRAGTCVSDGTCMTDRDCPSTMERCETGRCAPRPPSDSTGRQPCTSACDCRLGELCQLDSGMGATMRHCVDDPYGAPTVFVSTTGTGAASGRSPSAALNSIPSAITAAMPGDVIAVAAGSYTAPITIGPRSRLTLAGSYVACNSRRWVRDRDAASSILRTPNAPAIDVAGTIMTAASAITIAGFDIGCTFAASNRNVVEVAYGDGIRLEDNRIELAQALPGLHLLYEAVEVARTTAFSFVRNRIPAFTSTSTDTDNSEFRSLVLTRSNGTISGNTFGAVAGPNDYYGIHVTDSSGALTLENNTIETSLANDAWSVYIADCGGATTIRDNPRISGTGFPRAYPGATHYHGALHVARCDGVQIEGNTFVGGNAHARSGNPGVAFLVQLEALRRGATFSRNTVRGFDSSGGDPVVGVTGVDVTGVSDLVMDSNDIQLTLPAGIRSSYIGVHLAPVTGSNIRISQGTIIASTSPLSRRARGVVIDASTADVRAVTLDRVTIRGGPSEIEPPYGSVGVDASQYGGTLSIDRCDITGGDSVGTQAAVVFGVYTVPTMTNSVLFGGRGPGPAYACANNASDGRATIVGNALICGSSLQPSAVVRGAGVSHPFGTVANNILALCDGPVAMGAIIEGNDAASTIASNYVYSPRSAADVSAAMTLFGTGRTNVNGGTTPCFDVTMRRLPMGSPCIDAGPATLMVGGRALTTDFMGRMRPMGARYDIGPFEGAM